MKLVFGISLIALFTIEALGNAIVPLINIFMPSTMLPATILTIFIIFIEAYLLKRWRKDILFKVHFKYSLINNLLSSAVGSLFVFSLFSPPSWEILLMYPMMFIVTIIVETPMLRKQYQSQFSSWEEALTQSFKIHLHSYVYLFLFQPVMYMIMAFYLNTINDYHIKNWTDNSIIQKEIGSIYTIKKVYDKNTLKKTWEIYTYDIASQKNKKIPLILPTGNYLKWDIKGNILAYTNHDNTISIVNLITQKIIFTLTAKEARNIRISPNGKMIAILQHVKSIRGYRDNKSYFNLGEACHLNIYSLENQKTLYHIPSLAFQDTLIWSNDSKKIFFTSLENSKDFDDVHLSYLTLTHSYGRGYIKDGQFQRNIFSYTLDNNNTNSLVQGENIVGISSKNILFFTKNESLYSFHISNGRSTLIEDISIGNYSYSISPSGTNIVMRIPQKKFIFRNDFLTIINLDNPNKRLIMDKDYDGNVVWVK